MKKSLEMEWREDWEWVLVESGKVESSLRREENVRAILLPDWSERERALLFLPLGGLPGGVGVRCLLYYSGHFGSFE